jgi:hypothetical protein
MRIAAAISVLDAQRQPAAVDVADSDGSPAGLSPTVRVHMSGKEDAMDDPFVGTWTLNPTQSVDANHKPAAATMTWELDEDGTYLLLAEGVDAKSKRCREKPQRLRPDGVAYPVEGLPGLTAVTTRPNPNTIRAEAKREDRSRAKAPTWWPPTAQR